MSIVDEQKDDDDTIIAINIIWIFMINCPSLHCI